MENQDREDCNRSEGPKGDGKCAIFMAQYIAFKKSVIKRHNLIKSVEALQRENEQLEKEVLELEQTFKDLQAASMKLQQDRCAAFERLEAHRKELEDLRVEWDQCQKERKKTETALCSLQATLKQHEDSLEGKACRAMGRHRSRCKDLEVPQLEEYLKFGLRQLEDQHRTRNRTSVWLKTAKKLSRKGAPWKRPLRHPDCFAACLSESDEQHHQEHATCFLPVVSSSDEDNVTWKELQTMIAKMKLPNMLSPIPSPPPPDEWAQKSWELQATPPEMSAPGVKGQASHRTSVSWNPEEDSAQVIIDWLQDVPSTSSAVPVVDVLISLADKNVQFTFRDEPCSRDSVRSTCRFRVDSGGLRRTVCVDREAQTDAQDDWPM